jgi:autotransporter-associated beta strand protein
VYSGHSTWASINSTGNWSDYGNWDATGGAPGIYAGFATSDTATFPDVSPSNVVLNLNGANPSLNTLTFNSVSSGYNITGTGGGTLSLAGTGAAINVTGRQTISAPLNLANNTSITTNASSAALTITGNISGSGTALTTAGSGAVVLCGANSYTGATTLSAGTLQFGDGTSGHDGSIAGSSIVDNASLVFDTFTAQSSSVAISGSGRLTKTGPGTATLSGALTYTGGTTVSAGTLDLSQITTGSLTIASGAKAVLISSAGTNSRASIVSATALSIAGGSNAGSLDLTDNGLIITGATTTTQAAIAAMITSHAISSSVVSAHTGMALAYDFASNIHLTFTGGSAIWGGQTIASTAAATDLLVFPTLDGDANMDGSVNSTDVSILIPNLGKAANQTWGGGDFNGDGAVNSTDVSYLIPNLGKSVVGLSAPNIAIGPDKVMAAPEPASLLLVGLGGLLILRRRR